MSTANQERRPTRRACGAVVLAILSSACAIVCLSGCSPREFYWDPSWELRDVWAVDHDHAWAGGSAGVFYTANGGSDWQRVLQEMGLDLRNIGLFNSQQVGHILFASRDRALVRMPDGVGVVAPKSGLWETRSPGALFWPGFKGISFVDETNGWAYGPQSDPASGKDDVYVTDDGGSTWRRLAVRKGVYRFVAVSPDVLWITTDDNELSVTRDRGKTWLSRPLRPGMILFADREHAVLSRVGEDPIESQDGLFSLIDLPRGNQGLVFMNRQEAWAFNYEGDQRRGVIHSCDGGKTWRKIEVDLPKRANYISSRIVGEAWIVDANGSAILITGHGSTLRTTRVAYPPMSNWPRTLFR